MGSAVAVLAETALHKWQNHTLAEISSAGQPNEASESISAKYKSFDASPRFAGESESFIDQDFARSATFR
jgi:hypothetical protein